MKQSTVNTFGALGYSSLLVQWAWTILAVGLSFFTSDAMRNVFLPPKNNHMPPQPRGFDLPTGIEIIIAITAVIFAFGVIIYAIVSVPRSIGRSGQRVTHKSAKVTLPHVTNHRPLSKKQKRRLLEQITWTIKAILAVLPAALLAIPPSIELGLDHAIVVVTGLLLFAVTVVMFVIQFVLAKVWKIPSGQVW